MTNTRDPQVAALVERATQIVASSRQIVAHSKREREGMRALVAETRRVIEASRAERAERNR